MSKTDASGFYELCYPYSPVSYELMAEVTDGLRDYFRQAGINPMLLTDAQIVMINRGLLDDNTLFEDKSVNVMELLYRSDALQDMMSVTSDELAQNSIYGHGLGLLTQEELPTGGYYSLSQMEVQWKRRIDDQSEHDKRMDEELSRAL